MVSKNPRVIFRLPQDKLARLQAEVRQNRVGVQHLCESFVDLYLDFKERGSPQTGHGPLITVYDIIQRALVLKAETSEVAHA